MDAIVAPVALFRRVRDEPIVGFGFLVILLSTAASWLLSQPIDPFPINGDDVITEFSLPVTLLFGVLVYAVFVVVLHWMALLVGGRGRLPALYSATGLASAPNLFAAPIYLIVSIAGLPTLGMIGALGLSMWSTVLNVLAVREVHHLTTGQAIAALVLVTYVPLLVGGIILLLALFGFMATAGALSL